MAAVISFPRVLNPWGGGETCVCAVKIRIDIKISILNQKIAQILASGWIAIYLNTAFIWRIYLLICMKLLVMNVREPCILARLIYFNGMLIDLGYIMPKGMYSLHICILHFFVQLFQKSILHTVYQHQCLSTSILWFAHAMRLFPLMLRWCMIYFW